VALPGQQAEVQQLLDTLAWRIIVFIHNQVTTVDVNLVRRIVESEKPAHVAADIQIATQPFMSPRRAGRHQQLSGARAAARSGGRRCERGRRYGLIQHLPSLDPRWETGAAHAD